jgi:hypothetical protein
MGNTRYANVLTSSALVATAAFGNYGFEENSARTGDHCRYSESKMPCMVVFSCCSRVEIE